MGAHHEKQQKRKAAAKNIKHGSGDSHWKQATTVEKGCKKEMATDGDRG
jgi:hypothetical protein